DVRDEALAGIERAGATRHASRLVLKEPPVAAVAAAGNVGDVVRARAHVGRDDADVDVGEAARKVPQDLHVGGEILRELVLKTGDGSPGVLDDEQDVDVAVDGL